MNSAWQNLLNAMANLRLMPNKDLLEQLIIQAENLNESDYEVQSFAVMRFALAAAKEVYDNENATQDEVDASVSTLRNAVAKLTLSAANRPELPAARVLQVSRRIVRRRLASQQIRTGLLTIPLQQERQLYHRILMPNLSRQEIRRMYFLLRRQQQLQRCWQQAFWHSGERGDSRSRRTAEASYIR